MKSDHNDIIEMFDTLKLPVAIGTFRDLLKDPELGHYKKVKFLRELLTAQELETVNNRYDNKLR